MYSLPFMNTICTEHSDTSHSHKGADENSLTSSKYNTETFKRNKQQNTFQFYPLQHPLQISGKTDFCQATRKVYGSRLNKPLSERVINGRCQDIAHARACRHFDDIWTIADDQKFLSRFFRKQFLIKVSLLLSGNDNLQCERNSFKIHFHS